MTTTNDDDGFGDAEHATAQPEQPKGPKVPDIVARIGPPPRGALTRPAPRREYLVEQVIPRPEANLPERRGVIGRGQLHILAGEGGVGKGRWLLTVATAVAAAPSPAPLNGVDDLTLPTAGMDGVCGLRVNGTPEAERVLLLLGEDDATDLHQRFEGVGEALWPTAKDHGGREDRIMQRMLWASAHGLVFTIAQTTRTAVGVEVNPTPDFAALVAWIHENGPWSLIAMDPMSRFSGVDEIDNTLQTKVYTLAETLTKANDGHPAHKPPAVIVVDHTAKPGKDAGPPSQHWIRGASAKVNAARVAMLMIPGDAIRVTVDSEGRTAAEEGFDGGMGIADVGECDVVWHVVKNNGQKKADPVRLRFTKHGGIGGETPAEARERRKRQWHAAKLRGEVQPPKAPAPAPKGKASKVAADDSSTLDLTGID